MSFPWWCLFCEWHRNWKLYSLMSMHNTYYCQKKNLPETILNNKLNTFEYYRLTSRDLLSYSFIAVMHWCLVLMLVLTPDFTIVSVPVGGCKRGEKGIKNISIPKDTTSRQVFIDTITFWADTVKNYTSCRNWSRTLALSHSWGLTQWWRMFGGNQ